jgi:TPR repeat protein
MVMIIIRILFLSLLFFYGNAFADFQTILKKARQGDAESLYTLDTVYELGEGVAENVKEAFKWFNLAALQGYSLIA